ncbi:MAG: TonB family protein [Bacteroidales bacterium]|nr:TonB family protein [Bacteroidales bacterium]
MTAYIIKSSLSLVLMFGLYWFLLRQEKLFVFNRFFLLFAILFSLIIPFISIPVTLWNKEVQRDITSVLHTNIPEIITIQNPASFNLYSSSSQVLSSQINISKIFVFLYFSGVIVFLFRFLRNIFYISRQIVVSDKINYLGERLVLIDHEINPYCFFNMIFVNKQDYLNNKIEKELLSHELEHIKQSHSIDVVLVELIQIIYWFNPILFLYGRAVRINHEYIADNNVVQSSSDIKSYSDKLISFISNNINVPLTTGFNQSLTRKRLIMLTKSKPNRINAGIRICLIVNLIAVFFFLMSFKNSNAQSNVSMTSNIVPENIQQLGREVKGFVVNKFGKYLKGVTILVSGKNTGITTDDMGHFIISKVPKDASLTFSYNEYITHTLKPADSSEMVVKLIIDHELKDSITANAFAPELGTKPLLVIDGTEYRGATMADIDPYRVSSLRILKGKDATDKYGENGINGAIEIVAVRDPVEKKPASSKSPDFKDPNAKPILIIDGVVSTKELNDIPIQEVDKLSILKNELAYQKYGEKGKNGVIEIITKKKNSQGENKEAVPIDSTKTNPDQSVENRPYGQVEQKPEFQGGGENEMRTWIIKNMNYPTEAFNQKIEGRVAIKFTVNSKGKVQDITIISPINPLLDNEAKRVISTMPDWKPGKQDGKPVDVDITTCINFALK